MNMHTTDLRSRAAATPSRSTFILLISAILLAAANMRAAITSVPPLAAMIRESTGLSTSAMGWLTTIPLIGFAIFSPLAPAFARKFGIERTLAANLLIMTAGIAIRGAASVPMLFVGTIGIGIAIAVCNVLLPSIVKKNFTNSIGLMTGLYSMTMGLVGAISAATSVPLAQRAGLGWSNTLLVWGAVSMLGFCAWLIQARAARTRANVGTAESGHRRTNVWTSGLAWQITLFMGLQSFNFYIAVAWLPDMLISKGFTSEHAGYMLSLMQIMGIPVNLLIPIIAERMKDQRLAIVAAGLVSITGYIGLFSNEAASLTAAVVLMGLGQGASISLLFMLFALRTKHAADAAALSGMAQSMGYVLAALGPIGLGLLHDATGSWKWPIAVMVTIGCAMTIFGMASGRKRYVE